MIDIDTVPQVHPLTPAAIQRSADHRYMYEGQQYPGVTTILGILDKSGPLMSWAARQTAEAAIAMLVNPAGDGPSPLSMMLANVGEEGTVKALTSRSSWKRDEAASLGTEVHGLADLVVRGEPTPSMPLGTRTRVLKYAEWWKATGWKLRLSEALVVDPAAGYGGTFDLLAYDRDGRTVLADIKTGRGVYREAVLQLAAYGGASFVAPVGSPVAYPMPAIDRYTILHVTEDGVREVEIPIGTLELQAFYACIALHEWAETMKGRKL